MKKLLLWIVTLMLVVTFSLVGCKAAPVAVEVEEVEEVAEEPVVEEPVVEEPEEAMETIAPEDLKLGYVIHVPIPFTDAIRRGAEAAAKEYGVDVEIIAPSKYDAMEQIALYEGLLAKGMHGIVTVAGEAKAWEVPTNNAIDDGVLVYHANCGALESKVTGIVGTIGYRDGLVQGEAMFELPEVQVLLAADDVKVVVTLCAPAVPTLQGRGNGVMDYIKEKAPDWEILGPFEEGMSNEAAYTFYETQYSATPDVNIMISTCAFGVPAMSRHKAKTPGADYVVAGYDLEPDALQGIKDGLANLTLGQRPFLQGYLPIMAMCEYFLKGNPLAKGWIEPGYDIVTAENVDEVIERELDPAKEYEFYERVIQDDFTPIWEKGMPYSKVNETGRG